MKQLANRLGKTLAFVLPVVLVTTGTLAVTHVPWAPSGSDATQVLTASSRTTGSGSSDAVKRSAQDLLKDRLLGQLQAHDPGYALDSLQRAISSSPSLAPYCTDIARALGQAAVRKYHGDLKRAQSFARPVCDGSFAVGTLSAG